MTATIKTLDALKAATLRLERLESYCAVFSGDELVEVDWPVPFDRIEAHRDMRKSVAAIVTPDLVALTHRVLGVARDDVVILSAQLRRELCVRPEDSEPAGDRLVPQGRCLPPDPTALSLRQRLLDAANCYPHTEGLPALLREAAAVVPRGHRRLNRFNPHQPERTHPCR